MNEATVEMQKYKSHKEVWAFKIEKIEVVREDGRNLVGEANMVIVNREYMTKHKPEVGGYYVRYEDGYESFSPAEAFEGGYTKV